MVIFFDFFFVVLPDPAFIGLPVVPDVPDGGVALGWAVEEPEPPDDAPPAWAKTAPEPITVAASTRANSFVVGMR